MGAPLETITAFEKMTDAENGAYNLLVPELRKSRIDPRKSLAKPEGPYNLEEIEEDEKWVDGLEKIFEEDAKKNKHLLEVKRRAELFEALLNEGIELHDWFSKDAGTIAPSRYDDIKNGIDLLVEFSIGGFVKHLGLSIDVTTSTRSVFGKIEQLRWDVQKGHLAQLKYFASEPSGYRGVKNDIPKVIIGADFKLVRELAGIWLNLHNARKEKIKHDQELGKDNPASASLKNQIKKLQKKLTEHRVQFQILEEIQLQLKYFIVLAESSNKPLLVQKYQDALNTINAILSEKEFELTVDERQQIERDAVYHAITVEVS